MNSKEHAQHLLDIGNKYPFDGRRKLKDIAHKAARGILADLTDRGGIKHEFDACDTDVRKDIVDAIAEIIRTAYAERAAGELDTNKS